MIKTKTHRSNEMRKLKALILAVMFSITTLAFGACNGSTNPPQTPPTLPQTVKGVTFQSASYVYDGMPKSIIATGIPQGVTATYTNNEATNVGTYNAQVRLTGDGYLPTTLTATLTITEASFQGITMESKTVTYNGQFHKIEVQGNLPQGTAVNYTYNGEPNDTGVKTVGVYEVVANVTCANYTPLILSRTLTINRAQYTGLSLSGATYTYEAGQQYKLVLQGELPLGATAYYYYNNVLDATNYGVTAPGVYEVKVIVSNNANFENALYYSEYTATLTVKEPQLYANFISVANEIASASLTDGSFYTHAYPSDTGASGVVIDGVVKQTSFCYYGNATGDLQMLDNDPNSILVKSGGVAFQKDVSGTQYYLEAVFDATSSAYTLGNGFAGLIVAHGPQWVLNAGCNETTRLMVSIHGNNILSCASQAWGIANGVTYCGSETLIQADWTEFFTTQELSAMDKTRVKLGVLRYGNNNFAFFVNDRYCGSRCYGNINVSNSGTAQFGKSGIGIVGEYRNSGGATSLANGGEKIRDFKYSTNTNLISSLSAKIPAKSIDIYLIAGQSNAAGNAVFDEATMRGHDLNAIEGNTKVIYRGERTKYDWSAVRVGFGEGSNRIGAEVGMMNYFSTVTSGSGANQKYVYDANAGKYAGIVKTAVGGTGFDYATGNASWMQNAGWWGSPSWISANGYNTMTTPVRNLYNELVNNVVGAVDNLQQAGFTTIRIKGLFWMQGERHINSWGQEGSTQNNTYYKAFKAFITDLRSDLNTKVGGKIGQNLTGMKVLIGEVAETFAINDNNTVAKNTNFINLQRYIASTISGITTLDTKAFPLVRDNGGGSYTVLGSDNYHWNQNQMFSIGKLVGQAMLAF